MEVWACRDDGWLFDDGCDGVCGNTGGGFNDVIS